MGEYEDSKSMNPSKAPDPTPKEGLTIEQMLGEISD